MSDPHLILALDQGTTSSRALLFDHSGEVAAMAQREFEQIFPQPGWVEHDPEEIWESQLGVAEEAMRKAGVDAGSVAAIGVTNQRETTILWERETGRPIHNAIVWQDRRTVAAIEALEAGGRDAIVRDKTGLVPDAYFSATKIAWLLDNVDGARRRATRGELAFGTVDSWLTHRLTGRHVTDASNASRTMLYDLGSGSWDAELLEIFDLPAALLPEIVPSSAPIDNASGASSIAGVPVAGLIGDQQSALAGQLCFAPASAKSTYGTGCFLLVNTGTEPVASDHQLLSTVAWQRDGQVVYALEGSVFIGGAVVQWLRDGLGLIDSAADVEELAGSVDDSGGVYLVPAFAGLGAPHWDGFARGTICGLTRGSGRGHLARAALEAIAFQVADVVEAMAADTGTTISELRVDGGAVANDLLMQIQADLLQAAVVRPKVNETTALGAALMAGLAVGFWESPDELENTRAIDRVFEPQVGGDEVAERRAKWTEAVRRSRGWAR